MMVTTMNTDTGWDACFLPSTGKIDDDTPPIKERNVFEILINSQNQILVERTNAAQDLKDAAKNFILNPMNEAHLRKKKQRSFLVELSWLQFKATISLQTTGDTVSDIFSGTKRVAEGL